MTNRDMETLKTLVLVVEGRQEAVRRAEADVRLAVQHLELVAMELVFEKLYSNLSYSILDTFSREFAKSNGVFPMENGELVKMLRTSIGLSGNFHRAEIRSALGKYSESVHDKVNAVMKMAENWKAPQDGTTAGISGVAGSETAAGAEPGGYADPAEEKLKNETMVKSALKSHGPGILWGFDEVKPGSPSSGFMRDSALDPVDVGGRPAHPAWELPK